MFKINNKFLKSSYHIADLKLCSVRLNDNSKFPWLILIPKRKNVTDISDLNSKDQILLMKEIVFVSKLMKKLFKTSFKVFAEYFFPLTTHTDNGHEPSVFFLEII